MNRDQAAIVAAMQKQGWRLLQQREIAMVLGNVAAFIRENRSMDVRVGQETLPYNVKPTEHFCYVQAYKGRGWCDLAVSIATAAAKTSMTSEQFGDVLHAIGGGANGYTRPGYRNYYTVSEPKPPLESLVESGHMEGGGHFLAYYVTPKGAAEVGCAGCLDKQEPA